MDMPRNEFKRRLAAGEVQYGMWCSLADPLAAEICAGAGLEWVVIDGEHAPNDIRTVLAQLQAMAPYPVSPIVRLVRGDVALMKQYLDLGAQTLLVPMVESADQAAELVRGLRYPPRGVRGVANGRASRWGRVGTYWDDADAENCLVVQVETLPGVANIEAIAAVDGVDGIFVGPSDLAACMGHLGNPRHPEVEAAVLDALSRIRTAGTAAGVLTTDPEAAPAFVDAGATFIGIGVDLYLLARGAEALARQARHTTDPTGSPEERP
ncbi:MAG: 2-dehydro-3-deoxyglucarate aldolase [Acidimicrobiales bacterium]|nr:2-dehydro-3-deoxyglucarate aldolase [Acidimicrobiales bacterium]